jgi:hypothetical protein
MIDESPMPRRGRGRRPHVAIDDSAIEDTVELDRLVRIEARLDSFVEDMRWVIAEVRRLRKHQSSARRRPD